jgi:hypothetical protein
MQTEVKFLGKIISRNGIFVNPDRIDAVKKWPRPKTRKEVESFIGFTNYLRDHIQRFSACTRASFKDWKALFWSSLHSNSFFVPVNRCNGSANSENLLIWSRW